MTDQPTIGFVGLGAMGQPMATNLLRAGHPLRVYNRTPEKTRPLVEQGAAHADTPAAAATPGGVVLSIVANDAALEEVTLGEQGVAGRLGEGGVHLSMSTVSPETSRRLAEAHAGRGEHYVAAPVFGRPEAAAEAKLWICTSGPLAGKQRVRPILEALGQGIFDFGEDAAAAHVVKLCGNFMIAAAMEAMAEAFTLAEKSGISRLAVHQLFSETLFASPIYRNYGHILARQTYAPARFRLSLGRKDMGLVLDAAAQRAMPMPLAELVHDRLRAAMEKGRGDLDWTGMALEVSEAAGLHPLTDINTREHP